MNKQAVLEWLAMLTEPMGGFDILRAGCPECESPTEWPIERLAWYGQLFVAVWMLAYVTGEFPTVTSAFRCKSCNERRSGTPKSRHLAMTAGGVPYVAVDIQWPEGKAEVLFRNLQVLPDWLRQATGMNVKIGVIGYKGRRRIHLDYRANGDYVDDQS